MKAITREQIDSWKIVDSGLSERVVNCTEREGVATVGELRKIEDSELLSWRNLGVGSVDEIKRFFEYCDSLEQGREKFDTIYETLKHFLSESEFFVISNRYGIDRREPGASRNYYTLQHIANQRDLTRERVRQVQDQALQKLSTHLVMSFLRPFCDKIEARIENAGGVLACESAYNWNVDCFDRLNPCATTLLLSDVKGSGFLYEHNVFTCWTSKHLEAVYNDLLKKIGSIDHPLPIEKVSETIAPVELFAMLRDLDNLLLTDDGRVIYSLASLEAFMYEIMGDSPKTFHYKKMQEWLNDRLDGRTQRGHGYILHKLLDMKSFERKGFGMYEPHGR